MVPRPIALDTALSIVLVLPVPSVHMPVDVVVHAAAVACNKRKARQERCCDGVGGHLYAVHR